MIEMLDKIIITRVAQQDGYVIIEGTLKAGGKFTWILTNQMWKP
jgi:hypothetical protein